jgi:Tfp pilus assembly protein PilO
MTISALPDGPLGRAIAVALLLLVLAGAWLGIVGPFAALYQERAALLQQERAVARHMTSLAASLPALRAAAAAKPDERQPLSSRLAGATDALAAANLQTLAGQLAANAGIALSSIDTTPPLDTPWGRRIGVSLRVNGSYPALVRFVAQVLMAEPKMIVDDLEIHDSGDQSTGIDRPLDASLTVYGFRTGGGAS